MDIKMMLDVKFNKNGQQTYMECLQCFYVQITFINKWAETLYALNN